MKNFAAFLFCGVLTAFSARAETVVTTTTTTTTTTTSGNVTANVTYTPYLEGKPVIANMDFGHSTPLLTIPVGGTAVIDEGKVRFSL